MKRNRFTDEQIVAALRDAEATTGVIFSNTTRRSRPTAAGRMLDY